MTLMLRPLANECTPREPHTRWYRSPDGKKYSNVVVDDMGVVTCSEEVVDHLLTEAGYVESEPPAWAKLMPTASGDHEADWYDTHCPTCDAPEPTHTQTCAVVHVKVEIGGQP